MSEANEEFQGKGKAVPLFSMVTNNANGLSAYPRTTPGHRRRAAKMRVIKKFAEDYDAVLLQETKLNALEDSYLNFEGSKTFYSNKDDKHAGLATIIGPKLLRHYTPSKIEPKGDVEGNVLQVFMKSKDHHYRDFIMDNLYLKSGSDMKQKQLQLESLVHGEGDTVFMGGDFNFTEREEDGGSRIAVARPRPGPDFAKNWV